MTTFIALLRAINVGKRQVPMQALKALAEEIGFTDARTYVASGNLLFSGEGKADAVARRLEEAISSRFGFTVEVIVRTADEWPALMAANPFPEESEREPNRVLLLLSKAAPPADAADRLMERAQADEKVRAAGGALWFHFPAGVGTSKLTPAFIDKVCGSPTTGRNVRTVAKLAELAGVAE